MNELIPIDQSALARLRAKAALSAEIQTWKPAPGDVLEGVIVGSRKVDGPFGAQPQAILRSIDGSVVAVWLTGWLLSQMRAQSAEIGDLASITFHGKAQGKHGKTFNRMSVTVLKAGE